LYIFEIKNMKPKAKKQLILSLIKDDLMNNQLVNALNDLGLEANHYALHLQESIFQLMGIEHSIANKAINQHYFHLCQQISIKQNSLELEQLAETIYSYLSNHKV
jgi:hypothetical protein